MLCTAYEYTANEFLQGKKQSKTKNVNLLELPDFIHEFIKCDLINIYNLSCAYCTYPSLHLIIS